MIGFIADYEFVWGFQSKVIGLSKTPPSFYYPPPTTFIGALSEVIAKEYKLGEKDARKLMLKISENTLAISWKPINCVPIKYSDINRIIALKRDMSIDKAFDAPARGKTILFPLDDNAPVIRWFIVLKGTNINFNDKTIEIKKEFFWRIHRIGSRESLVSAVNIREEKVKEIEVENESFSISCSFPLRENIEEIGESRPKWATEDYIDPFRMSEKMLDDYIEGKNIITYKIPIIVSLIDPPEYFIRIQRGKIYSLGNEIMIR